MCMRNFKVYVNVYEWIEEKKKTKQQMNKKRVSKIKMLVRNYYFK